MPNNCFKSSDQWNAWLINEVCCKNILLASGYQGGLNNYERDVQNIGTIGVWIIPKLWKGGSWLNT